MNNDLVSVNNDIDTINSNLHLALTYNEETDYFGINYDGVWKDVLFAGLQIPYLYMNGNEFNSLSGGWVTDGYSIHSAIPTSGNISKLANSMKLTITPTGSRCGVILGTNNYVDITKYSKLTVVYEWHGIEYENEVDLTSVSSGYVSIELDNDINSTLISFIIIVSSSKTYVQENVIASNHRRLSYNSNLLTAIIKSIYFTV